MSDGITDAHRESRFKSKSTHNYVSMTRIPERCNGCIFITRNPSDNQWECTNPLQHGPCNEPNNCAFHFTFEELATYTRNRLKAKLTGESKMANSDALQCKHLIDNSHCANMDGSECPFISMWDKWVIASKMCKHYKFNIGYEVHVLGNSTSIIGVFKTREQAEQFIRDNVKVVEMTV